MQKNGGVRDDSDSSDLNDRVDDTAMGQTGHTPKGGGCGDRTRVEFGVTVESQEGVITGLREKEPGQRRIPVLGWKPGEGRRLSRKGRREVGLGENSKG